MYKSMAEVKPRGRKVESKEVLEWPEFKALMLLFTDDLDHIDSAEFYIDVSEAATVTITKDKCYNWLQQGIRYIMSGGRLGPIVHLAQDDMDGFCIWHTDEFLPFAQRLGIDVSTYTTAVVINVTMGEFSKITHSYISSTIDDELVGG